MRAHESGQLAGGRFGRHQAADSLRLGTLGQIADAEKPARSQRVALHQKHQWCRHSLTRLRVRRKERVILCAETESVPLL